MPWPTDRESKRRSDATYNDPEYRRNRVACLERARHRCEIALEDICEGRATQTDHIVAVSLGGTHALSNLRAACPACHRKVTAQQGGGYRRSQASDPAPRPSTAW